jgi:F-type H+-transporting ATPase subunit a
MEKKKNNLLLIVGIFLVVLVVLATFLDGRIHIGNCPDTGDFGVRFIPDETNMSAEIVMGIRPDEFIAEINRHDIDPGNPTINPAQYTNNSQFLYDLFVRIFGENSAILNYRMWRSILALNLMIIGLALFLRKQIMFIPTKAQIVFELIFSFIKGLVEDVLGKQNLRFLPYFLTLFLFILLSNWSGLLPIPGLVEPTRHLNVTLGLGIMSLSIVHFNAIKKKGLLNYLKAYCEPMFILAPINLVGEIAKVVSISFRLFGNIFGGAIIFAVIASLTFYVAVPVGLNLFFVLFAGTLQAFVFTMLSMTYLALEITDE